MAKKLRNLMCVCPVVVALVFILGAAAFAGNNYNGKVAVHMKQHGTSCTQGYPAFTSCDQIVFMWPTFEDIDVLPVFYDLVEYREIELTLRWPSQWGSLSWVRCKGDAATGTLRNPGDRTHISWSTCQRTWSVAPGYGWLHPTTPGFICGISSTECRVLDCSPWPGPWEDVMCPNCSAVGYYGDDPCRPFDSATHQGTWGQIKAMFK